MNIATRPLGGQPLAAGYHGRRFGHGPIGVARYFRACFEVARQRRELAGLDARLLRDIGLTEADVARETARSFWDIPAPRGRAF